MTENNLLIAASNGLSELDAAEWDALLDAQAHPTPFMRHAYLKALEDSGSVGEATGWHPLAVTVRERTPTQDPSDANRQPTLVAAAATYLKTHSYGEYVFDFAWADAYRRYGQAYYPKLVVAVPFTPVPGSRLLARDAQARSALLRALDTLARQIGCSSVHLLFGDEADHACACRNDWLTRQGVQFHWHNRHDQDNTSGGSAGNLPGPYADFAEFLSSLQREKRKKISQERRKVRESGVCFETLEGEQITSSDWDFFYACYCNTYAQHQSTPYLTRDFFAQMQTTMSQHWVLFVASRDGQRIACALIVIDRAVGAAWGRYWGALESVPCLHFEACYYQPLQWCIEQRFKRFEGGAQGEHKMARGLLAQRTQSAHWIAEPEFARAIAAHVQQEGSAVDTYLDELGERSPFA